MLQLNKFQISLDQLKVGSVIKLNRLLPHEGEYFNDKFEGVLTFGSEIKPCKLWLRHFLAVCEYENGLDFLTVFSSEGEEIEIPDQFEIVGFNKHKEKVIIRKI